MQLAQAEENPHGAVANQKGVEKRGLLGLDERCQGVARVVIWQKVT
jgi:hypothetical protein